jgi:hypothetical protein
MIAVCCPNCESYEEVEFATDKQRLDDGYMFHCKDCDRLFNADLFQQSTLVEQIVKEHNLFPELVEALQWCYNCIEPSGYETDLDKTVKQLLQEVK